MRQRRGFSKHFSPRRGRRGALELSAPSTSGPRRKGISNGQQERSHLTTSRSASGRTGIGARRFGVVQGGDYRPIDDYSGHGHKTTSGTVESMNPAASMRSQVSSQDKEVGGRTAQKSCDQDSGYGQGVPRELQAIEQHRRRSSVAVRNPANGCVEFFALSVCPFGARNVVSAFCWLARALQ